MGYNISVGLNAFRNTDSGGYIPPGTPAPLLSVETNGEFALWDGTPPEDPTDLVNYVVTVEEDGFTSTGTATKITEGFYVGLRVRKPFPDNSELSDNRVALGRRIYTGAVVNGGSVDNFSTNALPMPVFEWVDYGFTVIGNSHRPKAFAAHIRGIACVKYIYSDGVNTVEAFATNLVCEVSPVSGKAVMWYDVGVAGVNITSLTEGAITLRAIAYPRIGTLVYDTASYTDIRDQGNRYYRKHVGIATAPPICYIDPVAGNNATGVISTNDATARANPFADYATLTAGAASKAMAYNNTNNGFNGLDGVIFRIADGYNMPSPSTNRTQLIAAPIFEKHPDTVGYQLWTTTGPINPRCGNKAASVPHNSAIYRGFHFLPTQTTTGAFTANQQTCFILDNCTGDFSAATANTMFNNTVNSFGFLKDFTFTAAFNTQYLTGSTPVVAYIGCKSTAQLGALAIAHWSVHGCDFIGGRFTAPASANPMQMLLINTQTRTYLASDVVVSMSTTAAATRGQAIINYSAEECTSTERNFMFLAAEEGGVAETQTGNTDNVLLWHIAIAGFDLNCRFNMCYNVSRTAGGSGVNRRHNNWSIVGVINQGVITMKTESFLPNNGSQVGNWGVIFGADCQGNFVGKAPTSPGSWEYAGLRSINPGENRAITNDPLWVFNGASTNASGVPTAGGTDFHLQEASLARNIVLNSPVPFDQEGNPRGVGFTHAGVFA